jgi:phage gp45-like
MSDDYTHWSTVGRDERSFWRMHNTIGRVSLPLGDDSGVAQTHQINGYGGGSTSPELRTGMQRVGSFGYSSMPLPGAKGIVAYQNGNRGFATVIGHEDPRYRPKGLKPGETHIYLVDEAKGDGSGGKTRSALKAALGWITSLTGKTVNVGQKADKDEDTTATLTLFAKDVKIGADGTVTLTLTSTAIKLAGNVEITGDLIVGGKIVDKGDLSIGGVESGGGPA